VASSPLPPHHHRRVQRRGGPHLVGRQGVLRKGASRRWLFFGRYFRRPGRDEYFFGGGVIFWSRSRVFPPPPPPLERRSSQIRSFRLCFSSSFVPRPSFSPFPTGLRRRNNFRSGHRGIYTKNRKTNDVKKNRDDAQRGRTIGHNQWTWAMEKRDDRVAILRANAKKD